MDGRCRAAVRGQDPLDPRESAGSPGSGDGFIFAPFRHENNENENPISKLSILLCLFVVFVIDFSFSLCFTMNLDADFSKHSATVSFWNENAVFYNDFGCNWMS